MPINKFILTATIPFVLCHSLSAAADRGRTEQVEPEPYVGIQVVDITYEQIDSGTGNLRVNPKAIILVGGYTINDNFALEARVGFGNGGDTAVGFNEIELSSLVSLLGKLSYGKTVAPYAVFGFSDTNFEDAAGTKAGSGGLSVGAGVDFNVGDSISVGLEYIRYADVRNTMDGVNEVSALSLGMNYHF